MATGTAGAVRLAAADTSSEGPKCPSARVLHGLGALAKPGAKHQTQAGVAGWPDFDPDLAEEPDLIEPYLSAIPPKPCFGLQHPYKPLSISSFRRLLGFFTVFSAEWEEQPPLPLGRLHSLPIASP